MVEKMIYGALCSPSGTISVLCRAEIILICFQISRTTLNLAFNNLNPVL